MYEIIYDKDDGWSVQEELVEVFRGSRAKLRAHIRQMEKNGCYNITATVIRTAIPA